MIEFVIGAKCAESQTEKESTTKEEGNGRLGRRAMVTCPPELSAHGQKWAAIKGLSTRLNRVQRGLATQEVVKGLKVLCEVRGTKDLASLGIFFLVCSGIP